MEKFTARLERIKRRKTQILISIRAWKFEIDENDNEARGDESMGKIEATVSQFPRRNLKLRNCKLHLGGFTDKVGPSRLCIIVPSPARPTTIVKTFTLLIIMGNSR